MLNTQTRYRVINTTKKPPRINAQGVDERHISEKNGHSIQWRDKNDQVRLLSPDKFLLVSELPEGLLRMHQEGLVRIEQIKDVSDLMKAHTETGKRTTRRGLNKKENVAAAPSSGAVAGTASSEPTPPRTKRQAKAVEMGKDDYSKRVTMDGEPGTNPDGTPNFVVTAPSAETRKKNKEVKDTSFLEG